MTLWTELRTVDGRCISRTHGLANRYDYARSRVAADAECREDEVELSEFDDGDWYTVRGKPYARLVDDCSDTAEHHRAMHERQIDTLISVLASSPDDDVLDAAKEMARILDERKLSPGSRRRALELVNDFANLSYDMQQQAAE